MKNKYEVETKEQYTNAYIEETKKQLKEVLKLIRIFPRARFETCKKLFGESNISFEKLNKDGGYTFDMNYGNMLITLARDTRNKEDILHIQGDIELYDDDYSGGSGEFHYDEDIVKFFMKKEFEGIGFYSVV